MKYLKKLYIGVLLLVLYKIINIYGSDIYSFIKNLTGFKFRLIDDLELILLFSGIFFIIQIFIDIVKIIKIVINYICNLLKKWIKDIWNKFNSENGYLLVSSLIGIYVTVYTLIDAQASRELNNRTNLFTLFNSYVVNTNDKISTSYAMTLFSDINKSDVLENPNFFEFYNWFKETNPYEIQLMTWLSNYSEKCEKKKCGDDNYRISLNDLKLNNLNINLKLNFSESSLNNLNIFNLWIIDKDANVYDDYYYEEDDFKLISFKNSSLIGAKITNSTLYFTDFSYVNFYSSFKFIKSKFGEKYSYLDIYNEAELFNSNISYCNFEGANLAFNNLNNVQGEYIDFSKTILVGASFRNSKLNNVDFSNVIFNYDREYFSKSNYQNYDFMEAELNSIKFINSDLTNMSFNSTNLYNVNFEGATLNNVDFNYTKFENIIFDNVDLSNAKFNNNIFKNVKYTKNTIFPKDFDESKLIKIIE